MNSPNLVQLESARKKLFEKFHFLSGIQSNLVSEKAKLISELSISENYLAQSPSIEQGLGDLHLKSQASTLPLYEDLLTTLIHEIAPENDECEKVVLKQEIKRGKPTLNIKIQTRNGNERDVTHDKGGSIQNLLAIGLRFIYVARNSGRKFIIFDEADSGLSSDKMPIFSKMLDSLSRKTGIQVLYISHHNHEYFNGYGRVHNLSRKAGKIQNNILHDYEDASSDKKDIDNEFGISYSESYIRHIRLVNCMQHKDTILELSPYVNYIVGSIDIGKSSVVKVIKAMALNSCQTSYIRDGEDELMVQMLIEDDCTIEYRYKRKGNKRTLYRIIDADGNELHTSDSGDKVPGFMSHYFGLEKFKSTCPSISEQKNPSFVFDNDKFSEHDRAELLKLSSSTDTVQKMFERHHEQVRGHQAIIRNSGKKLNDIKEQLALLQIVNVIEQNIDELSELIELESNRVKIETESPILIKKIDTLNSQISEIDSVAKINLEKTSELANSLRNIDLLETIIQGEETLGIISSLDDILLDSFDLSESEKIKSISDSISDLEDQVSLISTLDDIEPKSRVEFKQTNDILTMGTRLSGLSQDIQLVDSLSDINVRDTSPVVLDCKTIANAGKEIRSITDFISNSLSSIADAEKQLHKSRSETENFVRHLITCPLCNQSINNHGHQ